MKINMEKEEKKREIPFVKPVRIDNYKLWRSRCKMTVTPSEEDKEKVFKDSGGKKKAVSKTYDIEQINISTLDGTWQVKIPATWDMFGMIRDLFAEGDYARLSTILANMMYSSVIANGYFHEALRKIVFCYVSPSMLEEGSDDFESLKKDARNLIKAFLEWRRMYDEKVKELEPTDEDMKQDDLAEQAMDILSGQTDHQ